MESERLLLRRADLSDIEAYTKIRNSEFVLRYNAMEKLSPDKIATELEGYIASETVFFMELKKDKALIGAVFATEDTLRFKVNALTLSYFLAGEYGGNGYMQEALRAVNGHLFRTRDIELISARVFAENSSSLKLLEKIGFQREGHLRKAVKGYGDIVYDDILFSILREEA